MQLKSILCAVHPLTLATSVPRSMQPLTSTMSTMCYFYSSEYHPHIHTTLCVVSTLETCTYEAPTLGVRIHSPIHIPHPLRKCSTPTLGEDTQKYSMSYSTYPIKLQIIHLIFPTVISALKGLADL